MANNLAYEDLIKLIDQIKISAPQHLGAFFTSKAWKLELKHHPDRFYRNDDVLMWLGAKVIVIGDDKSFWSVVDKIIPKENNK